MASYSLSGRILLICAVPVFPAITAEELSNILYAVPFFAEITS